MNDELKKKVRSIPQHIPDPSKPTVRATAVQCEVDGGAFLLVLSDFRPTAPYVAAEPLTRYEDNSAFIEMGRFALSPVTFCYLKQAMQAAEDFYRKYFGELPNVPELNKRILAEIPDRPAVIEHRLGFRAEPPTHPGNKPTEQ
jgi:hypothetical protein